MHSAYGSSAQVSARTVAWIWDQNFQQVHLACSLSSWRWSCSSEILASFLAPGLVRTSWVCGPINQASLFQALGFRVGSPGSSQEFPWKCLWIPLALIICWRKADYFPSMGRPQPVRSHSVHKRPQKKRLLFPERGTEVLLRLQIQCGNPAWTSKLLSLPCRYWTWLSQQIAQTNPSK